MKIIHITDDVSQNSGGVPAVIRDLTNHFSEIGIQGHVVSGSGDKSNSEIKIELSSHPNFNFFSHYLMGNNSLISCIDKLLWNRSFEPNKIIFHIHGMWRAPQYFAGALAAKEEIPFVFSAHGMLEPWTIFQQGAIKRYKKLLYWNKFAYPIFSKAAVVHAITNLERDHLRKIFPKNRIEIIPNAIKMECNGLEVRSPRDKKILFIGRIEKKKGVDILIKAFAGSKLSSEWSVDIVGPAWSHEYVTYLKKLVKEFNLQERVRFLGSVVGERKIILLKSAWVLVAPSYSEAIGLVNLEAAANYLPSITSFQTGLNNWEDGGGLLIQPELNSLKDALEKASNWTDDEQFSRGCASRDLVRNYYSWSAVLPMWKELYSSL